MAEQNPTTLQSKEQPTNSKGNHIITTNIEHPAVDETCKYLEKRSKVTYLPVVEDGIIKIDDLKAAITDETILITVMHANNEIKPSNQQKKLVR